jgi:endonuclease/exonuclease/phosphatase family metal-dependent hydrolase
VEHPAGRVKLLTCLTIVIVLGFTPAKSEQFTIVTYNVEHLFDADGVAVYDDLEETDKPNSYSPRHLLGKLRSIGDTLKSFNDGQGPEVVAFNEFEIDFTPDSQITDFDEFLQSYQQTTVEKMLTTELNDEIRGLPVEALLLKHLADEGMGPYQVAIGADQPVVDAERQKAHKNAVFTKFPIQNVRSHSTTQARDILEVELEVEGHPLLVFVNHWKSGASSAESESARRDNARVVRHRLQEVFRNNPSADVVVTGDFNSVYNQSQAFPYMGKTALNDVLGSGGSEVSVATGHGYSLYNLWYELPHDERKSDHHQGKWGTLMQTMISPGLYDYRGVQYVDNSFGPVVLPGINVRTPLRLSRRWTNAGSGSGASDHFPVAARFRVVSENNPGKRLAIKHPGVPDKIYKPLRVAYETIKPEQVPEFTSAMAATPAKHVGEIFRVKGAVVNLKPVTIEVNGYNFQLWSWDVNLRKRLQQAPKGALVELVGELTLHRGRWQFILQHQSWLLAGQSQND